MRDKFVTACVVFDKVGRRNQDKTNVTSLNCDSEELETAVFFDPELKSLMMMSQIFDLTEDALKRLRKLIPDESVKAAADKALASPARKCKQRPACVHRLILTNDQRQGIVAQLKVMLARDGFEEHGDMLPIGHVYEGFIQTFSSKSRVVI